jgi:hypothetical protein
VLPVAAQPLEEGYTIFACEIAQLDPGEMWTSGDNVLHIRNQVVVHKVYADNPLLRGYNTVTRNLDINLKTGQVHVFGSFDYKVEGVDGSWVGRFTIHSEPGVPYWGNGTAQGTGELKGITQKTQFAPIPPDYPNNPCENAATTGMHTVFFIDHRK